MAWTHGNRPIQTTIARWDKSWPTSVMSGRTGKKQARQHSFAKLDDGLWLTFNFRKACPGFAAQWYSAPDHQAVVRSGARPAHRPAHFDASRARNDRHICFFAKRLHLLSELPWLDGSTTSGRQGRGL